MVVSADKAPRLDSLNQGTLRVDEVDTLPEVHTGAGLTMVLRGAVAVIWAQCLHEDVVAWLLVGLLVAVMGTSLVPAGALMRMADLCLSMITMSLKTWQLLPQCANPLLVRLELR
jgi:hypothetical protein